MSGNWCRPSRSRRARAEELVSEPGLIASLSIVNADGASMTALEHLKQSHADRFVMMRDGIVLDEWLASHGVADKPHIIYSVSKSVTGMLAGIAVGDGRLDPDARVTDYVKVKPGSAYHAARVRDLLDMTVSLDFVENYLDTAGDFDRYRRATLWNPERGGAGQETMLEVLASSSRVRISTARSTITPRPTPTCSDLSSRRRSASASMPISPTGCGGRWVRAAPPTSPSSGSARRGGRWHLRDGARPRPFRAAGAGRRCDR